MSLVQRRTCAQVAVVLYSMTMAQQDCLQYRDLHKEVMTGIDEAVGRHAQETDKVDLATLKQLKKRVNALEEQIQSDKQKQLSVSFAFAAVFTLSGSSLTCDVHLDGKQTANIALLVWQLQLLCWRVS